jgi:glycosyltransferase involved in cell wall biosynthesis
MTERTSSAAAMEVPRRVGVARIHHSAVVSAYRERDRQLRSLGYDVLLGSPQRWNEGGRVVVLDRGEDHFVRVVATLGSHPYRFAYRPVALARFLWRARQAGVKLLDVHEEPASLAVAEIRLLRRFLLPGVPLTLYSAQNILKRYPLPFRRFERSALREATAIYICNAEAGEVLRHKGFRGKLAQIPLGVDVDRFTPDAAPERTSRPLHVGYVGRLEAHKGVDVALRAIARLKAVTMDVVGDGPARRSLELLNHDLGLEPRVHFSGFAQNTDIHALYRCFDVVVVPSLVFPNWVEQFGRVAIEAMASGVAVVATRTGALPDVVGDGGVLVPPGDDAALAQALIELSEPEHRHAVAARGREIALSCSWSAVARAHAELYESVL